MLRTQSITRRWCDVAYLLGGWFCENKDGPQAKWKGDPKTIKAVISFVTATGCLEMEAQ